MPQDRTSLVLGLLLVALGGGWLLRSLGFISPVDWAWTLGLARRLGPRRSPFRFRQGVVCRRRFFRDRQHLLRAPSDR